MAAPDSACPCGRAGTFGRPAPYARCCGRYLDHPDVAAPDAETLMRSRYTAYVRHRGDYLRATWDAARRPAALDHSAVTWTGLEVLRAADTGPDSAEVEFVASFAEQGGRTGRMHELSRFTRHEGRWYYVDGDPR